MDKSSLDEIYAECLPKLIVHLSTQALDGDRDARRKSCRNFKKIWKSKLYADITKTAARKARAKMGKAAVSSQSSIHEAAKSIEILSADELKRRILMFLGSIGGRVSPNDLITEVVPPKNSTATCPFEYLIIRRTFRLTNQRRPSSSTVSNGTLPIICPTPYRSLIAMLFLCSVVYFKIFYDNFFNI